MKKPMVDDLATILYLAHALPTMREKSDEAAAFLEAAIVECALSISKQAHALREQLDLAAYIGYAVEDIAAIAPTGAGLLNQAIRLLEDARPNVHAEPYVLH